MIIKHLLADAKPRKNLTQHFVRSDGAGDGAEIVQGGAEVLGDEVGRGAGVEGAEGGVEGFGGVSEGFVVAGVGDQDGV